MLARRRFHTWLSTVVLAPSLAFAVDAPATKIWRIGVLAPRHIEHDESEAYYGGIRQGLRELGYVEGHNLSIEWRSSEGHNDRLAELATELVNLKVDAIVTAGHSGAKAAQNATATIPIVVASMADPVSSGLVKSMARPGGNLTGINILAGTLVIKKLELLTKIVPKLARIGILLDPNSPATPHTLVVR